MGGDWHEGHEVGYAKAATNYEKRIKDLETRLATTLGRLDAARIISAAVTKKYDALLKVAHEMLATLNWLHDHSMKSMLAQGLKHDDTDHPCNFLAKTRAFDALVGLSERGEAP